jgi:hypothetical protein
MKNRHRLTRKAFGFYIVVLCVNSAVQQHATSGEIVSLLKTLVRYGKLSARLVSLCFLYICVYPWIRRAVSPQKLTATLYYVTDLPKQLARRLRRSA